MANHIEVSLGGKTIELFNRQIPQLSYHTIYEEMANRGTPILISRDTKKDLIWVSGSRDAMVHLANLLEQQDWRVAAGWPLWYARSARLAAGFIRQAIIDWLETEPLPAPKPAPQPVPVYTGTSLQELLTTVLGIAKRQEAAP